MDYIDLRSDTVSQPTPAMREAMATAVLGDDVYGEDPTVNELEQQAAERFGKEAGLFVTSGTMGNAVALLTHCKRGEEVIVGKDAHTVRYEVGGMAALGGIMPYTLPVQADGTFNLDDVRAAIRFPNDHFPTTRLICLENTHGGRAGIAVSKAFMDDIAQIARENNLLTHVDGARIFNAATALKLTVADLCENMDSVTFCLSKGLGAPVGSILVGTKAFIKEARRTRKMLGGGMRQAGILAAAGLIALNEHSIRLEQDHQNARKLAEGLASIQGIQVDLSKVTTNFVFFDLTDEALLDASTFSKRLNTEYNIRISPYPGYKNTFRAVTHLWITEAVVDHVLQAVREVLSA